MMHQKNRVGIFADHRTAPVHPREVQIIRNKREHQKRGNTDIRRLDRDIKLRRHDRIDHQDCQRAKRYRPLDLFYVFNIVHTKQDLRDTQRQHFHRIQPRWDK